MKNALNLIVSISLLVAAIGCETSSGSVGAGGGGGEAGMGGAGGVGGMAGIGGIGGTAGIGGIGGEGGTGGGVPDLLSGWGLFTDIRNQIPAPGVIPFEVTSPLFTDGALKHRFVTLTEGGTIEYTNDSSRWESPVGTIYAKTFAFPPNLQDPETDGLEQLVETRLMVHVAAEDDRLNCGGAESCWQVHVYVYDEEQTDAVRQTGGWTESITYTDPTEKECSDDQSPCEGDEDCSGIDATCDNLQEIVPDYAVPSNGACRRCHGVEGPDTRTRTLGPSTGMLNRGNDHGDDGEPVANQIDQLFELGMLAPEPGPIAERTTYVDPVPYTEACQTPACIHEAARSYFDSNCSHCHAPDGAADGTGIFLDYASMDPTNPTAEDFAKWGVCKGPTSGGGVRNCGDATVDILPGDPDSSILLCRMDSVKIGEMMAPLGRSLIDEDGYDLIRQWVTILPILFPDIPTSCSNEGTGGAGGAGGVGGAGI
jgi:hypothetical protein